MGGKRETKIEQKSSSMTLSQNSANPIRIHESQGEVHFHDDAAKLKVAVQAGAFWNEWAKIKSGGETKLIDTERLACLTIKNSVVVLANGELSLASEMNMQKIQPNDAYKKLSDFIASK